MPLVITDADLALASTANALWQIHEYADRLRKAAWEDVSEVGDEPIASGDHIILERWQKPASGKIDPPVACYLERSEAGWQAILALGENASMESAAGLDRQGAEDWIAARIHPAARLVVMEMFAETSRIEANKSLPERKHGEPSLHDIKALLARAHAFVDEEGRLAPLSGLSENGQGLLEDLSSMLDYLEP